jgi:hypothetical protein
MAIAIRSKNNTSILESSIKIKLSKRYLLYQDINVLNIANN